MALPSGLTTIGQFMLHVPKSHSFCPFASNRWNAAGFEVGYPSATATNIPAASMLVEFGLLSSHLSQSFFN